MPWLMKAEPDSRIVKGKDVKFSVDDFEAMGTSPWDGVRSHEAKKIMKERMKVGDKVFFYHSNCKTPGVYALAEVAKEGYPDSWDSSHPYFDEKTKQDDPTWYMVDVRFIRRLPNPPTLALVKYLASAGSIPDEVNYIGQAGWKAVREMQLVNRGRLSVQPVEDAAYDAIVRLGDEGGWEALVSSKSKPARSSKQEASGEVDEKKPQPNGTKTSKRIVEAAGKDGSEKKPGNTATSKRKAIAADDKAQLSTAPTRRSKRNK